MADEFTEVCRFCSAGRHFGNTIRQAKDAAEKCRNQWFRGQMLGPSRMNPAIESTADTVVIQRPQHNH